MIRKEGIAKLYDGTEIKVTAYTRPVDKERGHHKDKKPTQRYKEIITEGCEHFGVKQSYIDWLKNHPA